MFDFTIHATCGAARTGTLTLPHGTVETPAFMPVGTQGTVRTLSPADLKSVGAQLVLANTYHLHVRPGEDVVQRLGGLHRFMAWDRPLLTDSGGFQVFSLEGSRRVDEDGVEFQSHVDGSRRYLTPQRATEIQWTLGADIAMAFDHVVPGGADEVTARDALERTLRWLERCARRHRELSDGRTVGQSDGQRLPVRPSDGPVNIRNAEHREDPRPLDATCDCETCTTFSRGYLRHLFMAEELLGLRLLSLHNVRYLIRLAAAMRAAIRRNAFGPWAAEWRRRYLHSGSA